jgi:uncharacterized protein
VALSAELSNKIVKILRRFPEISLCFVFGSQVSGRASSKSDVDLGVAGKSKLSMSKRITLMNQLNMVLHKEVDVIDLQAINGVLLHQVLTTGNIILNRNPTIYAMLMKKMLFEQADFMPYYFRLIGARRKRFLGG